MSTEGRHRCNNLGLARVIAHRVHPRRQPKWVAFLAGLGSLADPLGVAIIVRLELEEPLAGGCVLHHGEVVLQAGAESHDVRCIPEVLGRPPFLVQGGDAATVEVSPNHLQPEAGGDEAEDPGGGNRELRVVGVKVTPVVTANRRALTNLAEVMWIFFHNPAPPAPPFIPPLLLEALRICALAQRPRDPSDGARDGVPLLNLAEEIVAEKHRAGVESGEALSEMSEKAMHAIAFGVKSRRWKP